MPGTRRTATGVAGGLLGLVGLSAVAGVLITATVTPAIALTGAATTNAISMFDNLPSVLEIDQLQQPVTLKYLNPDTGQYDELTKFFSQNRLPVTFDQIAPVMYDSILSSEDPRYYQHGGIDLIGTGRALITNLRGGSETQGGSSISQQYVKNILVQNCESTAATTDEAAACFDKATNSSGTDGIQRKLQEMRYAIALEQKYSKNEILLGYLNIANFGGTTYGIGAAASYYFNTTAANLTLSQAATLAGMVQNPNTYRIDQPDSEDNGQANGVVEMTASQLAPLTALVDDGTITEEQLTAAADPYGQAKARQLYVLGRLLDDGKITHDQFVAAAIEPITPAITPPQRGCEASIAPFFCAYVVSVIQNDPAFGATDEERQKTLNQSGDTIYTTLDPRLQSAAQTTLNENTPTSMENMQFGAAITSVEVGTGRVLSIGQNNHYVAGLTDDPANNTGIVYAGDLQNGGSTGFEAGSTFKLFTLIDWLEKGHSLNEVLNGTLRVIKSLKNSCGNGDWVNGSNTIVNNFGSDRGRVGTPMQFTAASLNTGFFAMAEKLDLCDIQKVATKMGVTRGDDTPIQMNDLFSIIGSNNVSPLAMAGAYATVASGGIYCQPKVIDKVTAYDGTDQPIPARTCTQVLDPNIAATAAYALQGVMNGGTGAAGNPGDGTALIGKTGTHEDLQTWLIESSTRVATASWVGTTGHTDGDDHDLFNRDWNGNTLAYIRYTIAAAAQGNADYWYPAGGFPDPDPNLTKTVLTDLPSVIGQTVDQATQTLTNAGFQVTVGNAVDSDMQAGLIAAQDPAAGKVAGGATVTISPSNGQGATIPNVVGEKAADAAATLRSAGFNNITASCTVDLVKGDNVVTAQNPAGGTMTNKSVTVTLSYTAKVCT